MPENEKYASHFIFRCLYSFVISRASYPGVLEDATLRDLDFVIPLIAVGDVIVSRKVLPFARWDRCSQENPHFSKRPYFLGKFPSRDRVVALRNEETRFTPATLYAVLVAAGNSLRAFRITMLSIDSIRFAIRRRTPVLYAAIVTSCRLSAKKSATRDLEA